jgi:hypothetical protein
MTRKSPDVRRTDSARCDPMSDTWLALIAHAGAVMRRFDLGFACSVSQQTRKVLSNDARRA